MLGIIKIYGKTIATITDGYYYIIPIEILYSNEQATYCCTWDTPIIEWEKCKEVYPIFTEEWYTQKGYYRIPVKNNFSPDTFFAIKNNSIIEAIISDDKIHERKLSKIPVTRDFLPEFKTKFGVVLYDPAKKKIMPLSAKPDIELYMKRKEGKYYPTKYKGLNVEKHNNYVKIEFNNNIINLKNYSLKKITGYIFTPSGLKYFNQSATLNDVINAPPIISFDTNTNNYKIVYNDITNEYLFVKKNTIAKGGNDGIKIYNGKALIYEKIEKITPSDFAYLIEGILEDYGIFLI